MSVTIKKIQYKTFGEALEISNGSLLLLLFRHEVGVNEHIDTEESDSSECPNLAPHKEQAESKCDDETAEAGHKPTHNHGNNTGDTIYSTLATPRLVRQRRTHSHHEADISG